MLNVKSLSVSYDQIDVLENINFSVRDGIVGIIGPNGAGKSTLIKAVLNLLNKKSGEITFNESNITNSLKEIAYIPQKQLVDFNFPINVLDVVLMGLYPKNGLIKKITKEQKEKALDTLKLVKMEKYAKTQIGELSGGEIQRVFMARALLQDPKMLLLDEPFSAIDLVTENLLMEILKELKDQGKLILIVHHDLSKVNTYFDQVIIINKELIAYGNVNLVFNETNLSKAYNVDFKKLGNKND